MPILIQKPVNFVCRCCVCAHDFESSDEDIAREQALKCENKISTKKHNFKKGDIVFWRYQATDDFLDIKLEIIGAFFEKETHALFYFVAQGGQGSVISDRVRKIEAGKVFQKIPGEVP